MNLHDKLFKIVLCIIFILLFLVLLLPFKTRINKYSNKSEKEFLINNNSSSKNPSNSISEKNIKRKSTVVDQVIKSKKKEIDLKAEDDILGNIEEKIAIEIILVNAENNEILENYDFEYYFPIKSPPENQKGKTNEEGKFVFFVDRFVTIKFVILTKDFADNLVYLDLQYGINNCRVMLFKNGLIEIKATNLENKVVEGIKCFQVNYHLDQHIFWEAISIIFDATKGKYVIPKIGLGLQKIYFQANGYQQTPLYTLDVLPNISNQLDIKMLPPRKILIDLDLKIKPEIIQITKPMVFHRDSFVRIEHAKKISKNSSGLYEFELDDSYLPELIVSVENYLPQSVNISCIKEKYLVSFLEGKIIELNIINEKGEPIKDAIVNFSVKKFLEDRDLIYSYRDNKEDYKTGSFVNSIHNPMEQKVTTNQLGIAILTGLYEKSILSIKVQHENYADFKEEWELGEDEQSSRNIVLKQPFKIFGKIIFEGKPVAGAIVLLSKEWQETIKTQSDTNGNFSFNNVPGNFDIEEYDITAFHLEYGIQNNFSLQKDLINKGINIELIKEQYCRIKLIDEKDQPVSNIKIILKEEQGNRFSGLKDSLIFSLKTDLNGIAEFYNLPYWNFEFFIDDEIYTIIKSDRESIDEMLYTLKKKDLRKILINLPNEPLLKSEIKVYIFDRYQNRSILNIRYIKNMYYIELENCESYLDHFTNDYSIGFIFELPGYPSVTFDNFHSKEDIPNEFQVNFQTGFNLKVKVIGPFQNAPCGAPHF